MAQGNHAVAYGRKKPLRTGLLLLLLLVLAGCSRPTDEQALRDTLAAMQAAV
jgi:hypothetical protein